MILRSALRIARTEFVASLRDRMTLVYTVLLPLAMYPVLFWVMIQGYLILEGKDRRTEVTVALVDMPATLDVERVSRALESPLGLDAGAPATDALLDDESIELIEGKVDVRRLGAHELEREHAVRDRDGFDAVVWFHDERPTELLFDGARSRSKLARDRVEARLTEYGLELRAVELERAGAQLEDFDPFALETVDLADEKDIAGLLFSLILPMLFVMMTVLGGFYPAVDATAGEKERKTAETTALLPVPPFAIVLGKILAVVWAAALATSLNVAGMALAAEHLMSGLGEAVSLEPPWGAMLRMTPFALVFLFFTACVLVAAASMTRTFKQGQSMLGAVQMLFLFPAIVGTLPVFDLAATNAWIPVMQTSLVFKALLQGSSAPATAGPAAFAIVLVTGLGYALAATWLAVALRRREDLFDEGFDPKTLLSFRRRKLPR